MNLLRSLEWPGRERALTAGAVVRRNHDVRPQFLIGHWLYVRATTVRAGEGRYPGVHQIRHFQRSDVTPAGMADGPMATAVRYAERLTS